MEIKRKTVLARLARSSRARLRKWHSTKGNQIIVGVHQNGTYVDVSGMSDGTRDQLYLAPAWSSISMVALIVDDI
jgi:hypothetical protein